MKKLMATAVMFALVAALSPAEADAARRSPRELKPMASKDEVIPFNTTVRVEVDPAGKPTKVEASSELPEVVRTYIEKRVAAWQYEPAMIDGAPASAVTHVRVGGCAVPVADGLRLGVDFKGNGPALKGTSTWILQPPKYPPKMWMAKAEGTFKVVYAIEADGSTRVTSIEPETSMEARHLEEFRAHLRGWIEKLHYEPERVDGIAVPTKFSVPVSFSLSTSTLKEHKAEREAYVAKASECQAARKEPGLTPLVLNSPVKVTPSPSG